MRKTLNARPSLRLQQAGDTIIEVIISIAVVSSILAGAFVVSNRSSQNVRTSEEHTQALQFLQGQIEQLRADVATKLYTTIPASFCYKADGTLASPGGTVTNCQQGLYYTLTVEKIAPPLSGQDTATFRATVVWDSLTGGVNQEQLFYRTQVATS